MDIKTGLIITGEFIFTAALVYLFTKEKKVVRFEERLINKIKTASKNARQSREMKRREKINRKAVYVPVKITDGRESEKAA